MSARIIPADAGSTPADTDDAVVVQDHPRGCGEHHDLLALPDHRRGSSPRMRGARKEQVKQERSDRIIPADAGSTHYKSCAHVSPWDHPRGCGEHPMLRPASLWGPGIIPADAGSTSGKSNVIAESEDHPRGCGEHDNAVRIGIHQVGSSPRMRGAPTHNAPRSYDSRIIPADAGSTTPQSGRIPGKRDHPRGCGEHMDGTEVGVTDGGSSPRMRGARHRVV